MLDVSAAASGSALIYGKMVENDSGLTQWLEKKNWLLSSQSGDQVLQNSRSISLVTKVFENLKVDIADEACVKRIVDAAKTAAEDFGKLSSFEKYDILLKAATSVAAKKDLLSAAVSVCTGRPSRYSAQFEVETVEKSFSSAAAAILKQEIAEGDAHLVVVDSSRPLADACRIGCLEIVNGNGVVVVPTAETALPFFVLADILNETGLKGLFNVTVTENETLTSLNKDCKATIAGDFALANQLRDFISNLEFELCGKTALVAMETCDVDAAVDAALNSLRIHSHPTRAAGVYALVHDSLAQSFERRLRQRLEKSRVSGVFDKTADFTLLEHLDTEEIKGTQSEVAKAGAARAVFGGQPSLPVAQTSKTGPVILVMNYRSVNELLNLLNSLPFISEVSLWTESQSSAWQIIQSINVKRVFVNNISCSRPEFDSRVTVNSGFRGLDAAPDSAAATASAGAAVDAVRNAQKAWQSSANRVVASTNFVRKVATDESLKNSIVDIKSLIPAEAAGTAKKTTVKNVATFELDFPLGIVALVAGEDAQWSQVLQLTVKAISEGCGLVYAIPESIESQMQHLIKLCGSAGIPTGLVYKSSQKDIAAVLRHHSVQNVIILGSSVKLPKISGDSYRIQSVWQMDEKSQMDLKLCLVGRKLVSLTYGDGLGN